MLLKGPRSELDIITGILSTSHNSLLKAKYNDFCHKKDLKIIKWSKIAKFFEIYVQKWYKTVTNFKAFLEEEVQDKLSKWPIFTSTRSCHDFVYRAVVMPHL